MTKGEIAHIEFPADDPERAKRFYAAVAGWEIGGDGRGHARTTTCSATASGPAGPSASAASTDGDAVRVYITVDNLEEATAAAEANGGTRRRAARRDRRRHGPDSPSSTTPRATRSGSGKTPCPAESGPQPAGAYSGVRLVDSHGHVNADRFDDDVELVLGAARLAGVERILVPGWNRASSERALALVDAIPGWTPPSASIPTTRRRSRTPSWAEIEGWARDERVVAIGETGPRLGPDVLALGGPARQPAAQPRARARDGQARDPPLPVAGGRARRPGRPARRAAAGRVRRRGVVGGVRGPPAGGDPQLLGPRRLRP